MPVERTTPQLVKKGKGKKRPGYRGDAGYRSGSAQASSIGQGNVGSKASFGGGKGRDRSGRSEGASGADRSRVSAQQEANHRAAIAAAQEAKRKEKNKNLTKFGYQKPKTKLGGLGNLLMSGIGMMLGIPGLGLLTGGFDKLKGGLGSLNETLGDFREKTTGFRTQKEYEDARTQRQLQGRLDNMYDRKSKGKGFSQKNIDMLEAMGLQPSTAQNVLTGRDLKGFTESRGLQTPKTFSDPFANTVGTTTKVNTPANDAVSSNSIPTVNGVPMINTGSVYQDNLDFFDNLNKGLVVNNEPPMVNTDNVMQGSVLDAKPKKGIMQMISDAIFSPAGAAEISPKIEMETTPLGVSIPTGDVGLNASGRLGNLSATIDAIDALKGESIDPQINYSGDFGNTNVYGNFSDDVQNLGLNFNNNRGLYGGVEYDAITGEPRANIGFQRTFEPGGGLSSLFTRRR